MTFNINMLVFTVCCSGVLCRRIDFDIGDDDPFTRTPRVASVNFKLKMISILNFTLQTRPHDFQSQEFDPVKFDWFGQWFLTFSAPWTPKS